MEYLSLSVSILVFLFWVPTIIEMIIGYAMIPKLEDMPDERNDYPRISVIVAAKDEEKDIEKAMASLLRLDYPHLEIIAINDRSTDATGDILSKLEKENSAKLRVIHIQSLPEKWLGKTHALHVGGKEAKGEFLLFTDADVVFEPGALRRVAHYAVASQADHLVAMPEMVTKDFWTRLFTPFFGLLLNFRFRIWEAPWAWAPGYVGVGAFNMIRRDVFHKIDGYTPVRMNIVEDMAMGRAIKRRGFRQRLIMGRGYISVEWIRGLKGIRDGLSKNAFAGYSFSWLFAGFGLLFIFTSTFWPYVSIWLDHPLHLASGISCLLVFALLAWGAYGRNQNSPFYIFLWPLAALLLIWITLRSAWRFTRDGGVTWRGTLYNKSELQKL